MFRTIADKVFSFDVEWVPDPLTGELLHGIEDNPPFSYEASFNALWADAGATPEKPRPYVKTVLCRIVSICGVYREMGRKGVPELKLVSLPADPTDASWTEKRILEAFLRAVGGSHPQLVGYNSNSADIPIIVQRSIIHGLDSHGFAERPEKPWMGVDYFAQGEGSVDLAAILGRWNAMPRLDEIATLSGIPGKIDVHGDNVWQLWLQGRLADIVHYNEFDALTTHLLWARMAHFAGLMDDKAYQAEQEAVRALVEAELAAGKPHMQRFLDRWDFLKKTIAERRPN